MRMAMPTRMSCNSLKENIMSISLEALLRRSSRMAKNVFDKHGEIPMTWLVDIPIGQQTIETPVFFTEENKDEIKDQLNEGMRELFTKIGVSRYVVAFEAWYWDSEASYRDFCEHRYQQEMVAIYAEDECECLVAKHEIIRPEHAKPYLGKLEIIERPKQIQINRWGNLLPRPMPTRLA